MMITQNFPDNMQQWVCLACGYNMIGEMPDVCPFCGATHDQFMAWDAVENTYRVSCYPVNDAVSQLLSVQTGAGALRRIVSKRRLRRCGLIRRRRSIVNCYRYK